MYRIPSAPAPAHSHIVPFPYPTLPYPTTPTLPPRPASTPRTPVPSHRPRVREGREHRHGMGQGRGCKVKQGPGSRTDRSGPGARMDEAEEGGGGLGGKLVFMSVTTVCMYRQTPKPTAPGKRNHDKRPAGWGPRARGGGGGQQVVIYMPSETQPSAGPRTGRFVVWEGSGNLRTSAGREGGCGFSVGWTGSLEWSSPT